MGCLIVDWDRSELRPRPNNPARRERFYFVKCGCCGVEYWLRRYDAKKVSKCKRCACREAGKAGFRATAALHGIDFPLKAAQQYQLANLSEPESIVMSWLLENGIAFQQQYIFKDKKLVYIIDFVVGSKAVKIAGWWHNQKKTSKDTELMQRWPGALLIIQANEIVSSPEHAKQRIMEFLQ